jgi:hypothetical protein
MRKMILPVVLLSTMIACSLPAIAPTLTPTPTEIPYEQCAFMWASHGLDDLSAQVQAAMEAAGLKGVTVFAEAFGEDCVSSNPKIPPSFGAMETDYRITIPVADLKDAETLGALLEKALAVLDAFPVGTTPGPNPGYVGVTFQAGSEELNLWFPRQEGESARAEGLHGAALIDRLQNK